MQDDSGMWVDNGVEWLHFSIHCHGVLYTHWVGMTSASAHDFISSFSSSIDLKKKQSQHDPLHPSFPLRVCSLPAAIVMHFHGQLHSGDADRLQRYDFIGGLVNHSLWCGISRTGGDQPPLFEMWSTLSVCMNFTTHNISFLRHVAEYGHIYKHDNLSCYRLDLKWSNGRGLQSWFPDKLEFQAIPS